MSNRAVPTTIVSMVDVDLFREWDGASVGVTVYNSDFTQVDDLMEQGYKVTEFVIVL